VSGSTVLQQCPEHLAVLVIHVIDESTFLQPSFRN
jgi:hypothetical protein